MLRSTIPKDFFSLAGATRCQCFVVSGWVWSLFQSRDWLGTKRAKWGPNGAEWGPMQAQAEGGSGD